MPTPKSRSLEWHMPRRVLRTARRFRLADCLVGVDDVKPDVSAPFAEQPQREEAGGSTLAGVRQGNGKRVVRQRFPGGAAATRTGNRVTDVLVEEIDKRVDAPFDPVLLHCRVLRSAESSKYELFRPRAARFAHGT